MLLCFFEEVKEYCRALFQLPLYVMETLSLQSPPPVECLHSVVLDQTRDTPLHAQLRNALERIITNDFADGARFYSETQLIEILRVSQGTVRRALADLTSAGIIVRKRAQATYVQKSARANVPKKLAVFVVDYRSSSIARELSALHAACVDQGIEMLPLYTHQGQHFNKAYNQISFGPDEGGVVLLGNSTAATRELEQALFERRYPFVTIDTRLPDQRGHFVGPDNDESVRLALAHLASLGHQKILLLVCEPEGVNTRARIEAFGRHCAALGVQQPSVHDCKMVPWDRSYDAARKAMEHIWSAPRESRPTAIFAISDMGALGAMKWLLERNVKIPGDVSVIGFDGIDTGAVCHPALTSLLQPSEQIAAESLRVVKMPVTHPQNVYLRPVLLVRESTGPAPS